MHFFTNGQTSMAWRLVLLVFCLAHFGGLPAFSSQTNSPERLSKEQARERFQKAVEAYKASDWEQAGEEFQSLSNSWNSASVAYNLGNVRYQQGKIGRAVAAWRRSLELDPQGQDVAHNLEAVTGAKPWGEGALGWGKRLYFRYSAPQLETFAWVCFGLASIAFGLYRLGDLRSAVFLLGFSLTAGGILGLWSYGRAVRWLEGREAIVVGAQAVDATAGPGTSGEYPKVFTVHAGQLVQVHRKSGRYRQISLPTGAAGWMPMESLEEL